MMTDRKDKDPALREALRQELATKPHFQLVDGWEDAVIKQVKSTSRQIVWTVAAAFIILFIGTATVLWQQKAKDRYQESDVLQLETTAPKEESPVVIAQADPTQSKPNPSTGKSRHTRKRSLRKSKLPRQNTVETTKGLTPTSFSANRDRMRQEMFKKMNRHSDMTELEIEIVDEI